LFLSYKSSTSIISHALRKVGWITIPAVPLVAAPYSGDGFSDCHELEERRPLVADDDLGRCGRSGRVGIEIPWISPSGNTTPGETFLARGAWGGLGRQGGSSRKERRDLAGQAADGHTCAFAVRTRGARGSSVIVAWSSGPSRLGLSSSRRPVYFRPHLLSYASGCPNFSVYQWTFFFLLLQEHLG